MHDERDVETVWEDIYAGGRHLNRYPFDAIVSFLFRNRPDKPRSETAILEVGCGVGNNMWFAAREGFQVAGVDISATAIDHARKRFERSGLEGAFHRGDAAELPWTDASFDLAWDRFALTCVPPEHAKRIIAEVHRLVRPGGRFLLHVYSTTHTSHQSGQTGADGVTVEMTDGTLQGVGGLCFYDQAQVSNLFQDGWRIVDLAHMAKDHVAGESAGSTHSEWHVVAERR